MRRGRQKRVVLDVRGFVRGERRLTRERVTDRGETAGVLKRRHRQSPGRVSSSGELDDGTGVGEFGEYSVRRWDVIGTVRVERERMGRDHSFIVVGSDDELHREDVDSMSKARLFADANEF